MTRKQPVLIFALICLLGLATTISGCDRRESESISEDSSFHSFTFETMGTIAGCNIELPADLSAADAEVMVRAAFDSVNSSMSTWDSNSEISRLNRAAGDSLMIVSPWLSQCLAMAQVIQQQSAGAFDPTAEPLMRLWGFYRREGRLPGQAELDSTRALLGSFKHNPDDCGIIKDRTSTHFDLGAIAKGLAVDLAGRQLRRAGVKNGLIDLGGNLYCIGAAKGRDNWRVGIRDPQDRDKLFAVVETKDTSLATSGSYERFVTIDSKRYGHIMNPATGRPAEGLLSATIIAKTGILADGLSTAVFVLGPKDGLAMLSKYYPEIEAVLVLPAEKNGRARVLATADLLGRISILPEYQDRYYLIFSSNLQSTQLPQSISRGGS